MCEEVLINSKWEALTVGLGPTVLYTFDRRGRIHGAFVNGVNYRRGLDGRVLAKWAEGKLRRRYRRELDRDERLAFLERARQAAETALSAVRTRRARLTERGPDGAVRDLQELPQEDLALLGGAAEACASEVEGDREKFYQVYRPVPILPPDKYLAIVLQATEGCSYNRCTFCTFYRGVPFRVKGEDEFRHHVQAVKGFLGAAIRLRRAVFLGDANALAAPHEHVRRLMEVVGEAFNLAPRELSLRGRQMREWMKANPDGMDGVYSFLDVFNARRMTTDEFAELADLGLRRVYIGLESGNRDLLRFLRKPGRPEDAVRVVKDLKAAGIAFGVIVMLGVGGRQYADGHVRDTVETLRQMALGLGDIIYFSPFVEEGTEYEALAAQSGICPLSEEEMSRQRQAIQDAVREGTWEWPAAALYDIREFVY
ncbi:MAG: radical SAM protein [Armatimonadota bacterium]